MTVGSSTQTGANDSRTYFGASISSTPSLASRVCLSDGYLLDRFVDAPWCIRAGTLCDSCELDCPLVGKKGNRGLDFDRPLRDDPYRASIWIRDDRANRPGGH